MVPAANASRTSSTIACSPAGATVRPSQPTLVSTRFPNFMDACSLISSQPATTSRRFSGRVRRPARSRSVSSAYSFLLLASASARSASSASSRSRRFAVVARSSLAFSSFSVRSRACFRARSSSRNRVRAARFSSAITRTISAASNELDSSRHGASIAKTSA